MAQPVKMGLRRVMLACAALCAAFALARVEAQPVEATESSVKAAFLFKFAGYVEWSSNSFTSADAPFVFAVLGSDRIAQDLAKIVPGRMIGTHPVVVRRLKEGDSLAGVHILFVGKVEAGHLPAILKAAQQQGVLPVTESERGLESGSAINFVLAEDRVGFEVSLDAAEKSGHRISSRMLAVARRVLPKAL